MRAKALILGMILTLCVSADTPAADLGAINIQNNIETIGNNISVLNKDLNVTKLQKKTVKKKNKKKTKLSEIDKYWSGGLQKNCGVIMLNLDDNGYKQIGEI